ncbi:MAG: thioredoxin-dependent thiol peroxidase [Acidimicrobiales bacterium]
MPRLGVGDHAPPFTLVDQDGNKVSLVDYSGRRLVLYFYPKDDTPGCTTEACQFNDNLAALEGAAASVLGISPDLPASHLAFRAKHGLGLRLASDPSHKVMERYGAWGEKTMYGRRSVGVIRSTFVLDTAGRIRRAFYNVRADGHAAKVLAELGL